MNIQEYHREPYTISNDPTRLNIPLIYEFLTKNTYWAQNRTFEVVKRSIENSLNFGIYKSDEQVGYARVVTDYATFAWLCDVFVVPGHRQFGLGKWVVDCVINHPDLKPLRRILLATRNAHELYRKYGGFEPIGHPERWMEKFNPDA